MAVAQTGLGKVFPFLDKTKPGYDPNVNGVGLLDILPEVKAMTTVVLTAAQVKALFTTPITLVAAPGAGKYIIVDDIEFKMPFGTVAYTGANAVEFRYTDGAGAKVSADIAAAVLNAASGTTNYNHVKGVVTALVPVANAPVVVAVPTANPGAGDSIVTLAVYYHVVTP